jgi:hypothetical protein
MKIYTFYTDTHKEMFEQYFVPSVPFNVPYISEYFPQECASGSFHADGWMKTMNRKVDYVIRSIQETWGSWFIHSDCDVQFFPENGDLMADIETHLNEKDIVGMDDIMMCAGFFACRSNDKTLKLWSMVQDNLSRFANDQIALNHFLPQTGVSFGLFPRFRYYNYMHHHTTHAVWNGQQPITLSPTERKCVLVHHANYTVGVENKVKMLQLIKEQVKS